MTEKEEKTELDELMEKKALILKEIREERKKHTAQGFRNTVNSLWNETKETYDKDKDRKEAYKKALKELLESA